MLAGVDFSVSAAPTDFGRVVRALLDAGRRGVAGTGAMMLWIPPPTSLYAVGYLPECAAR